MNNEQKQMVHQLFMEIVRYFDNDYSVAEGEEFTATFSTNTITYTFQAYVVDFYFIQDMYRRAGPRFPLLSSIICSLFHEIGHLEMADELIDDTVERNAAMNDTEMGLLESFEMYSQFINERNATNWAIAFIRENRELVEGWDRRFRAITQ